MTNASDSVDPIQQRTLFFESCRGVFQGGGCRAIALAGALNAATQQGINFTGGAGASAGSIVAALVGAGATPQFIVQQLNSLDLKGLLRPPIAQDAVSYDGERILRRLASLVPNRKLAAAEYVLKWGGLYSGAAPFRWTRGCLRSNLSSSSILSILQRSAVCRRQAAEGLGLLG